MKPRAIAAELFGTFCLTLAVLVSINNPELPIPTPVIAGLTVGIFVYTIGPVSGAHLNPAVTVGLATIRKIDLPSAAAYMVAQIAGALLALGLGKAWFPSPEALVVENTAGVGVAEAVGALVLLFGVAAVVLGVVPSPAGGIVIGSALTIGIALAAHASNGVLNPAVALGIGSLSFAYVWGPVVGAILGALLLRVLVGKASP